MCLIFVEHFASCLCLVACCSVLSRVKMGFVRGMVAIWFGIWWKVKIEVIAPRQRGNRLNYDLHHERVPEGDVCER